MKKTEAEQEPETNFISKDEEAGIKSAFDLFADSKSGRIKIDEILDALSFLGYDKNNKQIFEFYKSIADNERKKENEDKGISFEEFIHYINEYLRTSQIRSDLLEIFNLFLLESDNEKRTITPQILGKIFNELGENANPNSINEMIQKVSKNGKEIDFDDFFEIMTNSTFP